MKQMINHEDYVDRDVSWMYFNHRILQEAEMGSSFAFNYFSPQCSTTTSLLKPRRERSVKIYL